MNKSTGIIAGICGVVLAVGIITIWLLIPKDTSVREVHMGHGWVCEIGYKREIDQVDNRRYRVLHYQLPRRIWGNHRCAAADVGIQHAWKKSTVARRAIIAELQEKTDRNFSISGRRRK